MNIFAFSGLPAIQMRGMDDQCRRTQPLMMMAKKARCFSALQNDATGPSVWTGRALQAENADLEKVVLRICIRPIDGA
jgi:hypothetical protein